MEGEIRDKYSMRFRSMWIVYLEIVVLLFIYVFVVPNFYAAFESLGPVRDEGLKLLFSVSKSLAFLNNGFVFGAAAAVLLFVFRYLSKSIDPKKQAVITKVMTVILVILMGFTYVKLLAPLSGLGNLAD